MQFIIVKWFPKVTELFQSDKLDKIRTVKWLCGFESWSVKIGQLFTSRINDTEFYFFLKSTPKHATHVLKFESHTYILTVYTLGLSGWNVDPAGV